MNLNVRHFALVTLSVAIILAGTVDGAGNSIQQFRSNTQLSTVRSLSSSPSSYSSSSSTTSSSLAVEDDSWFSWANWRRILLQGGESRADQSRTFGLKRRLQMIIIPLVFKFGVISTLIFVLVALGLKTVFLLKTLLILNLAGIIAKFFIWKSEAVGTKNHVTYAQWIPAPPPPPSVLPFNPHEPHGIQNGKEVHLHIHNSNHREDGSWEPASFHPESHVEPYGSYSNPIPSYVHPTQRRNFKKIPLNFNTK